MGRRRFDPDEALERAMRAFWQNGYADTSAQDLVEAMGVNRASIYATYGNKADLYRLSLSRYLARDRERVRAALDGDAPLVERLGTLLHRYARALSDDPSRKGCFFANACIEARDDDPALSALLADEIDAQQGMLQDAVADARRRGEHIAEEDDRDLAAFLLGLMQGMRVVGKATGDRRRLEAMVDIGLSRLEGGTGAAKPGALR